MNDLKLFVPVKPKTNMTLFIISCVIILMFNACKSEKQKALIYPDSLPSIYVSKNVSDDREHWFNKHKFNLLNELSKGEGALGEIKEEYTKKVNELSNLIDKFLKVKDMDGFRIYLATRGLKKNEVEIEDKNNCGRFNFILVCTVNKSDNGTYYRIKGNKIKSISDTTAQKWVRNYQKPGGKRNILDTTLTTADQIAKCFETKHLWFCKQKATELKKEIDNQLKKDKNAGIKIKLVSYTGESFIDGAFGGKIPQSFKQRLTVEFVFTDKDGREVYIDEETINKRKLKTLINNKDFFLDKDVKWKQLLSLPYTQEKWNKILELLNSEDYRMLQKRINNIYTMDTGLPAPPPPKSKEKLDIP